MKRPAFPSPRLRRLLPLLVSALWAGSSSAQGHVHLDAHVPPRNDQAASNPQPVWLSPDTGFDPKKNLIFSGPAKAESAVVISTAPIPKVMVSFPGQPMIELGNSGVLGLPGDLSANKYKLALTEHQYQSNGKEYFFAFTSADNFCSQPYGKILAMLAYNLKTPGGRYLVAGSGGPLILAEPHATDRNLWTVRILYPDLTPTSEVQFLPPKSALIIERCNPAAVEQFWSHADRFKEWPATGTTHPAERLPRMVWEASRSDSTISGTTRLVTLPALHWDKANDVWKGILTGPPAPGAAAPAPVPAMPTAATTMATEPAGLKFWLCVLAKGQSDPAMRELKTARLVERLRERPLPEETFGNADELALELLPLSLFRMDEISASLAAAGLPQHPRIFTLTK